ncbi:hypothetical protein ACLKOZ_17165 [Arthrobacter sp. R4]|uniref:hypothetical protein n=1 Tax=Arthrobacter sp. R4 TaxID=644417 RepID=UPI003EDAAD0D
MDDLESMRRAGAVTAALGRAPGGKVTLLDPRPLVKVRVLYGRAIAYTPTHVLHEWVRYGEYHCKWDQTWQVHRVAAEEWRGEALD